MPCKTCQLKKSCMYAFDQTSIYCPDRHNRQEQNFTGRPVATIRAAYNMRGTLSQIV